LVKHLPVLTGDANHTLDLVRVLFQLFEYRRHLYGFWPRAENGQNFHLIDFYEVLMTQSRTLFTIILQQILTGRY